MKPYTTAVAALFDAQHSRADLLSLKVQDPHTLILRWRLEGALNVPGHPRMKPYTGTTRYIIHDSRVKEHLETWDISALDAFVSVLLPSFGAAPAPPADQLREQ